MKIETKILREYRGVSSSRGLQHALAAFADGQHGTANLRAVLREHAIGTTLTRPALEDRTLAADDVASMVRAALAAWSAPASTRLACLR